MLSRFEMAASLSAPKVIADGSLYCRVGSEGCDVAGAGDGVEGSLLVDGAAAAAAGAGAAGVCTAAGAGVDGLLLEDPGAGLGCSLLVSPSGTLAMDRVESDLLLHTNDIRLGLKFVRFYCVGVLEDFARVDQLQVGGIEALLRSYLAFDIGDLK